MRCYIDTDFAESYFSDWVLSGARPRSKTLAQVLFALEGDSSPMVDRVAGALGLPPGAPYSWGVRRAYEEIIRDALRSGL